MAFCPKCGNQAQGAFCMRCGSPVPADAPQPPQQPQQPPPNPSGWQQQQPPPPQQPQYGQPQQQPFGQQPPQYGQQPPPQYPPQYGQQAPASAGIEDNVASALCYTPFIGLVVSILFLVLEPFSRNKSIRFHAFQSIFLTVASFVLGIVLSIVFRIFYSLLPYGLWSLVSLLYLVVWLVLIGGWIFLMYKAYNRERFKIPIIGDLAEKQA